MLGSKNNNFVYALATDANHKPDCTINKWVVLATMKYTFWFKACASAKTPQLPFLSCHFTMIEEYTDLTLLPISQSYMSCY